MRPLLLSFTALLTLALDIILFRALFSFPLGVGGFGAAVGGLSEKLSGLLIVLSALFIVLLLIYRRRERRKLK